MNIARIEPRKAPSGPAPSRHLSLGVPDAVSRTNSKTMPINFPTVMEPKTSYSVIVDKGAFLYRETMTFLGMPVLGEWKFAKK